MIKHYIKGLEDDLEKLDRALEGKDMFSGDDFCPIFLGMLDQRDKIQKELLRRKSELSRKETRTNEESEL